MAWNLTDETFVRGQQNLSIATKYVSMDTEHEVFQVLARLKKFKDEGIFCDLKLFLNGAQFDVHRAVIAAWSPKLASVFTDKSNVLVSRLVIDCEFEETFPECLEYMYSGSCIPNESSVIPLLALGRGLMIDGLVTICENYLQNSISLQDFIDKFFLSLQYDLKILEEIVVDFIETNIATVIEQHALLNLQPPDFKTFLTSGKMNSVKQEVKFSLIISWVGCNIPEREKYLMYLFNLVSWTHSVNDLLIQISCTQNIFTTNEFCLFQLLHSLVTAIGHHLGPFITAYPRLYSVYSHMLEDLTLPNAFLAAGQYQKDISPVVITPVPDEKVTNDIAVNTDFEYDLSGFQEIIPEITESLEEANKEVNTEEVIADPIAETTIAAPNIEMVLNKVSQDSNAQENTVTNSVHRRKGLPRKLPQKNRNKDTKEKKRKTKKSSGKDAEQRNGVQEDAGVNGEIGDLENTNKPSEKEDNTIDYIMTENTAVQVDGKENDTEELNGDPNDNEKPAAVKSRLKITLKKGKALVKQTKSTKRPVKSSKRKKPTPPAPRQTRSARTQESPVERVHCTYENCDFSGKTNEVLDKHVERVHLIDVNLSCWKCDFTARQMRDLCQHLKEHFPKAPFICDIEDCGMRFLRLGLYVRHHMTHMKEKPYQCDMCMKSFATYNQLSCHKKLHEGRQFECDVCYKKFGTKGSMQQHRAIHFDNKPYLCDLCGFSTKHQSHLISHRKIHTGDVKRCTFPNCNYSTPKSAHMTQHMNSHYNIRNHICQVCGKSFVVRSKLLRHERIHLKDKLYKCKQCEYQTSRTDRMKLHIESHGIKLKKKNRYNMPSGYDYDSEPDIDYHQLYEKVHPQPESGLPTQVTVSTTSQMQNMTFMSMSEMKPMDVISFAASSSMIMESYSPTRIAIDTLSTEAAVSSIEDIQGSQSFQQNFERIQTATFDQL